MEYFGAMLAMRVPNIEMHIYGNGRHPGDPLPDGSHMTGGLTDRNDTPFGTWQYPIYRLVPRSWVPAEAWRGDQSGQG